MVDQIGFSTQLVKMVQGNLLTQLEEMKKQQTEESYKPVESINPIVKIKQDISLQIEQSALMLKIIQEIHENELLLKEKEKGKFQQEFENEFQVQFKVTQLQYDLKVADQDDICQKNFGNEYRVANWEDLEEIISELEDSQLNKFIAYLGYSTTQNDFAVHFNGSSQYSSHRYYFASWHNYKLPDQYLAHQSIKNNLLSLGSWTGSFRILCIKKHEINQSEECESEQID